MQACPRRYHALAAPSSSSSARSHALIASYGLSCFSLDMARFCKQVSRTSCACAASPSLSGGLGGGVYSASAPSYFSMATATSPALNAAVPSARRRLAFSRRSAGGSDGSAGSFGLPVTSVSRACAACRSGRFELRSLASRTQLASDARSRTRMSSLSKPSWSSHTRATNASPRTSVASPHWTHTSLALRLREAPFATPWSSTYMFTPYQRD
mmetsp:Transcript_21662/g.49778  ORF Transcript_21662/g.49778 Transcript_21662/m.49778 type:complete len:212 (-) Transcript_21662:335-970(-)